MCSIIKCRVGKIIQIKIVLFELIQIIRIAKSQIKNCTTIDQTRFQIRYYRAVLVLLLV